VQQHQAGATVGAETTANLATMTPELAATTAQQAAAAAPRAATGPLTALKDTFMSGQEKICLQVDLIKELNH
jgi:hypothetical protein